MTTNKSVSVEDLTPFTTKGKKSSFKSGNLFSESQALTVTEPLTPAQKKTES